MTEQRKQLLKEQIDATFSNISKLQKMLAKEDRNWANEIFKAEEEGTASDDDYVLALEIANVGENLKDWGNEFRF
jgi:hypothetical protein